MRSVYFWLKISSRVLIFSFSLIFFLSSSFSEAWEISHSLPKYDPRNDTSTEAAGVIIYSVVRGRAYVLLGKEKETTEKGTYCFMLGHLDDDSTLVGAAREMNEESAGIYHIDPSDLAKFPYFEPYEAIFIVPGQYVEEKVFNDKSDAYKQLNVGPMSEMNDYVWVALSDLREAVKHDEKHFVTTNPSGIRKEISLRNCALRILEEAEKRHFLEQIPEGIHAGPMWADSVIPKPAPAPKSSPETLPGGVGSGYFRENGTCSVYHFGTDHYCGVPNPDVMECLGGFSQVRDISSEDFNRIVRNRNLSGQVVFAGFIRQRDRCEVYRLYENNTYCGVPNPSYLSPFGGFSHVKIISNYSSLLSGRINLGVCK